MFAIGLVTLVSFAAAGPQVKGDFDGNGATDTAFIVEQTDGTRKVIITFDNGRQAPVPTRVDQHAVLNVVSSAQVAAVCAPFEQVVPECSQKTLRQSGEGITFRPTSQEVKFLAWWTGFRFIAMGAADLDKTTEEVADSNRSTDKGILSPRVVQAPCKINANGGRLIEEVSTDCRSVIDRSEQNNLTTDRSLYTVLQLQVNELGKVENCDIAEASGSPELDTKACMIAIEKARFAPMPGAGSMKRQTRRLSINWSMPR